MTDPLSVSVVIPVRDGANYLLEAIDSCIAQTMPPLEIIVVDDGSTDHSAELARSRGVAVLSQKASGVGVARNLGSSHANGDLISFLDADDRMTSRRLELHEHALRMDDAAIAVVGSMVLFESRTSETGSTEVFSKPEPGSVAGNLTVRRRFYLASGGQTTEPELAGTEYMEWYIRTKRAGFSVAVIDDVTLERRIHDANWTRDITRMHKNYLALARKTIQMQQGPRQT